MALPYCTQQPNNNISPQATQTYSLSTQEKHIPTHSNNALPNTEQHNKMTDMTII